MDDVTFRPKGDQHIRELIGQALDDGSRHRKRFVRKRNASLDRSSRQVRDAEGAKGRVPRSRGCAVCGFSFVFSLGALTFGIRRAIILFCKTLLFQGELH